MSPLIALVDFETILIISIPIGAVVVVLMTAIMTSHHRKLRHDDMEATLKMEMIQRGMAAEEIERVLAARMATPSRHGQHSWQQQRRQGAQAAGR